MGDRRILASAHFFTKMSLACHSIKEKKMELMKLGGGAGINYGGGPV